MIIKIKKLDNILITHTKSLNEPRTLSLLYNLNVLFSCISNKIDINIK
jgi:hypothetical protein